MYAKFETPQGKKILDWDQTERHAKTLTDNELLYAIRDCTKAGESSNRLENSGHRVSKDQGFYHDERGVYSKELRKRQGKIV